MAGRGGESGWGGGMNKGGGMAKIQYVWVQACLRGWSILGNVWLLLPMASAEIRGECRVGDRTDILPSV
jgi:hypothetical protein